MAPSPVSPAEWCGAVRVGRPLAIRPHAGLWLPLPRRLRPLYTELGLAEEARNLLWQLLERVDRAAARQSPWAQWTAVLVFLTEAALALGDVTAARLLRSAWRGLALRRHLQGGRRRLQAEVN